ncbi:MAG: ABC transporter ATP-binding protein [Firmicutes bacterium]|nr:ABC transporter ATP-binding protein [Bacillota bacterium]
MLETQGVGVRFGGLQALSDVNVRIEPGEIVGLIGPNGAGKTTLFNVISGLVRPTSGAVRFRGQDITGLPPHRIAQMGIGRTFQVPRLFARLSSMENVLLGSLFRTRSSGSWQTRRGAEREARQALEFVGLEERGHYLASREPTGRRKLLELAMVIAARPQVLLLDEPMAGLNPGEVKSAMHLIRRLRDERGVAIFWVEHVMDAVMGTADRVIVLDRGSKIAEGPPAAVVENPAVQEAYLGERWMGYAPSARREVAP